MANPDSVKLAKEVEAFKAIQKDLSKNVTARQQLMQQQTENDMVLEELNKLGDDANVFKMIGPALIKQDMVEAKSNVTKRLEYIRSELDRLDNQHKSLESKATEKQQEVLKLQQKQQQAQAAMPAAIQAA